MVLPLTITPGDPGHDGDHEEIHDLLDDVDAAGGFKIANWLQGTYAAIPAAGDAGRLYYATDALILFFDNGAAWKPVGIRHRSNIGVSSGDITLSGVPQDVTGTSISFTTILPNAVWVAHGTCDFIVDTTSGFASNNYMTGDLDLDGANQAGQIILQDNGNDTRGTPASSWRGTIASAGAHTWKLRVTKSVGTGTHRATGTHTKLVVEVFEGAVA